MTGPLGHHRPRLARPRDGRPAAPVRMAHLGLGNFFGAHQAWYTDRAPDADAWGYAAFTGRHTRRADDLAAQNGLYTLVTRAAGADRFDVLGSVSLARPGTDVTRWRDVVADPAVAVVTLTVTEAAYLRGVNGGVNTDDPDLRADVDALRADPRAAVSTVPARLVAGLAARRHADAGPLTLVPCDNLPRNGRVVADVVRATAELVDPDLAGWLEATVSVATTVVDRITPRTTEQDVRAVADATGRDDACPVVTEPFAEWTIGGSFPAGRPAWDRAGDGAERSSTIGSDATVLAEAEDVAPYEQRKLWLLNGAHSLLAYTGSVRGHATVADAVDDPTCRDWTTRWWDEAARHLTLPDATIADYRTALLDRFANPRIRHQLAQIAADGSTKLPVRIVPVLRRERAAGRVPSGAVHAVAGWVAHLAGVGAPVHDANADRLPRVDPDDPARAVPAVLRALDPDLADNPELVAAVRDAVHEVSGRS